jgi:2-(1,2-epoxy-1,2-dihydrophenyl)acetyl-CoA isomerase
MEKALLENLDGGVLTLTLNRPDRLNALNTEMLEGLLHALHKAAADREVGAILLSGAGRAFCAGGDVKAMAEREGGNRPTDGEAAASLRQRMEASRLLHDIPKPTIAAIRGPAAGAGLALALACDIRIGSDTARLTTAFAKVALSGDFGGTYFLTQLVGSAKARELYFTSPILDAQQAKDLGLLSRLVPDAALDNEARALARSLADGPRVTLGYMKKNFNLAEYGTLPEVMDSEAWHHSQCVHLEDHREAARAFVEKRAPAFKGR